MKLLLHTALLATLSISPILSLHAGPQNATSTLIVQNTGTIGIENVRQRQTAAGALISGRIRQSTGNTNPSRIHICFELRNAEGVLIATKSVRPTPAGHPKALGAWGGRSTFAATIPAPAEATITLSAHSGNASACHPS